MATPKRVLGPERIAEAAQVIEESFDPETGRHPSAIFHAISRTTVRPTVELAIFTPDKDRVLLTRRAPDDPYFPDMWHLPGVMVVTADIMGEYENANDNAALRAIEELEGTKITGLMPLSPKWVRQGARLGPRGGEEPWVYGGLSLDDKPVIGEMFEVEELPEPIYGYHPQLIMEAQIGMTIAPAVDLAVITY